MVRLPRIGPKLAAPPTDLDEDSMERLDALMQMAGDEKVVTTRRLVWLAVVFAGPLRLKEDRSPTPTGETILLTPHTVVMTPQQHVGIAKVSYYLTELQDGRALKPARVTDVGEGHGWWHLDGLHRLLAARILGQDLEAQVYR